MKYRIPVLFTCSAEIEVEAQSLSEAIDKALDSAPLPNPKDWQYVEDSCILDSELCSDQYGESE